MKSSVIILIGLTMIFAFSLNSFAQNKAKAKTKAKITKPVSNSTFIGETEKNLSKAKNTQNKTESSVFEPNDANTWIEAHEFDVAIKGKNSTQSDSSKIGGKSKQNAVTPTGTAKKPVVFEDVIISSKTTKPKSKPTKAAASKRKPN